MTPSRRIVLFGECMIELRGQAFGAMQQGFGGDTLNTAVYLARLCRNSPWRIAYTTALGDDLYSAHMIASWREEGIDTALVRRLGGRLPGLYAIQVDSSGERHFAYWRDSSAARGYFAIGRTPLEDAADALAGFYLSGISLAIMPPEGRERLLSIMARVRAGGGRVAFDNNFRPHLWASRHEARALYDRAYAASDIALITLDDEMALRGETGADRMLAAALALPTPEVAIKRGGQPAVVRTVGAQPAFIPTADIPRIVDTTAAGDSFAGAYLAARLAGATPAAAALAANRLAGIVIQHPGAIIPPQAMPELADLLADPNPSPARACPPEEKTP